MRTGLVIFPLLLLLLTGCSRVGGLVNKITPDSMKSYKEPEIPEVPKHLRAGREFADDEPNLQREVAAGVDPADLTPEQGGILGLPSEDEMMWTDPDNPYESEELLKTLGRNSDGPWEVSHTLARREAMTKGKPLLIWFTDTPSNESTGSPSSVRLEQELFSNLKFNEWAEEHLIRLKLDFAIKGRKSVDPEKKSLALKKERYLLSLKERYGVRGYPSLLVVAGDGSVIQRVRGYRTGNPDYTWGLLRTAVELSQEKQKSFEEKLARKGYRHWRGANDLEILAKLASYDQGKLLLISPDGTRYQTHERNLSKADRDWIADERERRTDRSR